jgi:hypothetical protein
MIPYFDYVDFGCGRGGSLNLIRGMFGPGTALGVDSNPSLGRFANNQNYAFAVGDAVDSVGENRVYAGVVSAMHMVEHLPSKVEFELFMRGACRIAQEFVIVNCPIFDGCDRVRDAGFKFYWEEMSDHTYHVTVADVFGVLLNVGLPYTIYGSHYVHWSQDDDLIPIDARVGSGHYDRETMGEKQTVKFDPPIPKMLTFFSWASQDRRSEVEKIYNDNINHKLIYRKS